MKPLIDSKSFKNMLAEVDRQCCWCCGRTERDRPEWWHIPWIIERAHFVNKPRVEDRRVCILACPLCHKGAMHGERFKLWQRPRLSFAAQLWLKIHFDPGYWDKKFVQHYSVVRLPRPLAPQMIFRREFEQRTGLAVWPEAS